MSAETMTLKCGWEVTQDEWDWLGRFIGEEIPENLTEFQLTINVNDAVRYQFGCIAQRPKKEVDVTSRGSQGFKAVKRNPNA